MLDMILEAGMNPNLATVIFTYGDTIYNPGNVNIPEYLIVHESTHTEQQGNDPDSWWARYVKDPYFRLQQEVEAYGNQFAFMCETVRDRNKRSRLLLELGHILSGPTYGNMITREGAMRMIKERSGVKP